MPPRLSAPARREQLLEVALEVFARQGFHGTSMNDVADAAGVTKPVLYQHFDSKRELYLALLEDVGNQLITRIAKATSEAPDGKAQTEAGITVRSLKGGRAVGSSPARRVAREYPSAPSV